jgi:hypothetical protein
VSLWKAASYAISTRLSFLTIRDHSRGARARRRNHEVPRVPLPDVGVTSIRETWSASSEDITPRSSLLRTHASIPCGSPVLRLLASFEKSAQVATSPCCYRDSPDVISANLSPDAWSPTPTVPPSAPACFFLGVIGLPKTLFRSASRWYPRTRSHYRAEEKAKISLEAISRQLRSSEKRNAPNERQKRDAVGRPDWRSSFLRDPGAKFLGGKLNKQKTH